MVDERERKDYYQRLFLEELKKVDSSQEKPTLFLHACCGPCLTYPLSILIDHFQVTVGFFNPNIQPLEEYNKRLKTLEDFLVRYGKDKGAIIPLVVNEEDFLAYEKAFEERKNDREGGNTCLKCHAYRLNLAYRYAYLHHYDYFTTVMTVSCKKPSRELNEIAERLAKVYSSTKYLYSDFKKDDGQLKGIRIAKEYQLYRQNYCGCLVSLKEREDYINRKKAQSEKDLRMLG